MSYIYIYIFNCFSKQLYVKKNIEIFNKGFSNTLNCNLFRFVHVICVPILKRYVLKFIIPEKPAFKWNSLH